MESENNNQHNEPKTEEVHEPSVEGGQSSSNTFKSIILVTIALAVLAALASMGVQKMSPSDTVPPPSQKNGSEIPVEGAASLYLSPSENTVSVGETFTVDVLADTGGKDVLAVQANLMYDSSILSVQEITYDTSAFGVEAPSKHVSGMIEIARGKIPPAVNDDSAMVATIHFVAESTGVASVSFDVDEFGKGPSRLILQSENGIDILAATSGGTYTVEE